ncbi:MAG: transposase [Planctomycetes bacterium]|nr:transposase [Planctomycetota bacterium]
MVSRTHHPETLGKCERFWKTVQEEFWERAKPQDLHDARARLGHFIAHYNHFRPQQGIAGPRARRPLLRGDLGAEANARGRAGPRRAGPGSPRAEAQKRLSSSGGSVTRRWRCTASGARSSCTVRGELRERIGMDELGQGCAGAKR